MSSPHHKIPSPQKILVCSLAGIGDTLIATPLIHELRLHFPKAQIDVFVRWPGSHQLLQNNPHVDQIIQHDFFKHSVLSNIKLLLKLRKNRYDLSINTFPQSRVEYRIVSRIIGAKLRLSHRYPHFAWLTPLLINRSLPHDYNTHCVEQNLRLLSLLGLKPVLQKHSYEVYLSTDELQWAAQYAADQNLHSTICLGVHIGSGRTKNLMFKRWPTHHYATLLNKLIRMKPHLTVMLFAGPDEIGETQHLKQAVDSPRVLLPYTPTVRHLAALLQYCHLYLSVDNFVMHLAAAMRVPRIVVIESPAWNPTIAPYGANYVLVPNPIVHGRNLEYYRFDGRPIRASSRHLRECMESVSPDSVLEAILQCLNGIQPINQTEPV